jgi:5'-nucleotidase
MVQAQFRWMFSAFAKAVFLSLTVFIISCKETRYGLKSVTGSQAVIDATITSHDSIDSFIKPYRNNLEAQMDSTLTYSKRAMNKNDYKLNTPLGNLFAGAVMAQAGPVFLSRTGKSIDVVLLNHGGIRASMPQGRITMRNAYEIMPFENKIVVAQLNGTQMKLLVDYLVDKKRAHPIAGLKIVLKADGSLKSATINGAAIKTNGTYFVATNDYLYNGGDDMSFFKDAPLTDLDYKLRSAIVDYFISIDTLKFERDDRFDYEITD